MTIETQTFSYGVKRELCAVNIKSNHCAIAELSGIIHTAGVIVLCSRGTTLELVTENKDAVNRIMSLFEKIYDIKPELSFREGLRASFVLRIEPEDVKKILEDAEVTGFSVSTQTKREHCCKVAYLRGSFIGGGSINHPKKNYRLEFAAGLQESALTILNTLSECGMRAAISERKDGLVVYVSEFKTITELLVLTGAHSSVLEMENIHILKDIRNNVNRQINCESANIDKTVRSASKQISNIRLIDDISGLNSLPPALIEAAELRLAHPEASLEELAELCDEGLTRSAMNNRLRRINSIAEKLR